jgi:hypothetical protein
VIARNDRAERRREAIFTGLLQRLDSAEFRQIRGATRSKGVVFGRDSRGSKVYARLIIMRVLID